MKKLTYIFLIVFSLSLTALPAYASMFDAGPKHDEEKKSTSLTKAEKAFVEGDYEEAVIICNSYATRRGRIDGELQYIAGRALLKLGRFDEARNRFSRILNHSDKFPDRAYMGLADSYYLEGDYGKAKAHYENVVDNFSDSEDIHIAYYRLGECCAKLGDKEKSKEYYDELIKAYPNSMETKLLAGGESDFVTYSVQAGSFEKWSNAKRLCDELAKKGFDANIFTTTVGDRRFYRVRVGQYDRLLEAENMARSLRNKGYAVKIYP